MNKIRGILQLNIDILMYSSHWDWDDRCWNADAGGIGLNADAMPSFDNCIG